MEGWSEVGSRSFDEFTAERDGMLLRRSELRTSSIRGFSRP